MKKGLGSCEIGKIYLFGIFADILLFSEIKVVLWR